MANLTTDSPGPLTCPGTPGSHADNLVLQIWETR